LGAGPACYSPGMIANRQDNAPEAFRFIGWEADAAAGVACLYYAFAGGETCGETFCETLDFGAPLPAPDSPLYPGFARAMAALHLAAGISYYKALLPPKMIVEGAPLSRPQRDFFQTLYENGLGEFSARNRIKAWERVNFPYAEVPPAPAPPTVVLPRRSAVLIGGGKDSLVSLETLRAGSEPLVLFAVNPQKPILECAAASGLPFIAVQRRLDEKLFALNAAGALNGHIPVTAIVSLIAVVAAFVHGFDTVVLSNERSANEGNLVYEGRSVNHQYSKTLAFERSLHDYIAGFVSPSLHYLSLLRPLSEFHIARLFARVARYDDVFTSCNRAFVIRSAAARVRWCCDCPKCRFAFLILATAMGRERMMRIFGKNLLDDAAQLDGYRELTGLSGHKPWECVGEIAESSAALLDLADDGAWRDAVVVAALAPALRKKMADYRAVEAALTAPSPDHLLPARFERVLHDYLAGR
jgi:UDP-N-acetyl-alpha-D-muramoyl-L-alanyl-L-glutamate epimerase